MGSTSTASTKRGKQTPPSRSVLKGRGFSRAVAVRTPVGLRNTGGLAVPKLPTRRIASCGMTNGIKSLYLSHHEEQPMAIDRREFLKTGVAAGAATLALGGKVLGANDR